MTATASRQKMPPEVVPKPGVQILEHAPVKSSQVNQVSQVSQSSESSESGESSKYRSVGGKWLGTGGHPA